MKVKSIKTPKKWTISHVWKAILAGQIKNGVCDGRYTDDYAFDAAVNFQKGEISLHKLAKELIDHSGGWWVNPEAETETEIYLSVNCHHFNLNTLVFSK